MIRRRGERKERPHYSHLPEGGDAMAQSGRITTSLRHQKKRGRKKVLLFLSGAWERGKGAVEIYKKVGQKVTNKKKTLASHMIYGKMREKRKEGKGYGRSGRYSGQKGTRTSGEGKKDSLTLRR